MPGGRNDKILRMTKANENTPKTTDLTYIWSRPLDFNDHNVIFNYQRRNEYDNSFRFIQSYDLTALKDSIKNDQHKIESFPVNLYCNEQLLPSDDENDVMAENLGTFCDSDDSIKDKDYIPGSSESCSDDENKSNGDKLKHNHLLPKKQQTGKRKLMLRNNDVPITSKCSRRTIEENKISDQQSQESIETIEDINKENKSTENRKKTLPLQEIKEKQQLIQEEDQNKDAPTVPEPDRPTMEEKENDRPSQEEQVSDQRETMEDINKENKSTENRKNPIPLLEIKEKQQLIQEEDQNKDVPTVPEPDRPTMEEKENDRPSQDQVSDQRETMEDINKENKSTENRKNAIPLLEIKEKQQLIQEEDQNKDVPTVPEPDRPTMEEKENDRPSQEDQVSDQRETMEDINKENKSTENRKNAIPLLEIKEKQQLIQEEDQNKDVPFVPEPDGPTMEEKENDRPSQEDQISDQQLQERIMEEINTPRRLDTDNEISDPMNRQEIQVNLTKSGKPRQRKCFTESKEQRILKKDEKRKEKLALKSACQESCLKKCTTKITEAQRREIHDSYVNMNYEEQGIFIKCMITEKPVQRRLAISAEKRKNTLVYHLKVDNTLIEVCKTYFLTTLGYNSNNDCRVRSAMQKPLHEQQTKRGTYERKDKIDRQIIENHIKTFNPCISHYRREHAPNRLYLPSDITIKKMHEQFSLQFPYLKVSMELYRVVVKEMNISFARLGHEECEQCTIFDNHNPNHNEETIMYEDCDDCLNYVVHKLKYNEARDQYQSDADQVLDNSDDIFYSVDLQKVIMLPRIDQYKTAVFCSRIIAFNESFVPIGKNGPENVPFAAVWNETISGRNQEDIISTFQAFLIHKRDAKNVTLWLDNCAAQNKNWALLSSLVEIVNSDLIAAKSITLKYFETGHTFMSADSFHHQVEMALKRMNKVHDFHDFVDCVRSTNSTRNYVKVMDFSDFFSFRDCTSQHKLRKNEPRIYLKDMVAIKVERGHYILKFKESHKYGEFQTLDFLQTKIMKTHAFPETSAKTEPRGISEERKNAIITKLVPLMPENRRKYWLDLPVSDAKDLALSD